MLSWNSLVLWGQILKHNSSKAYFKRVIYHKESNYTWSFEIKELHVLWKHTITFSSQKSPVQEDLLLKLSYKNDSLLLLTFIVIVFLLWGLLSKTFKSFLKGRIELNVIKKKQKIISYVWDEWMNERILKKMSNSGQKVRESQNEKLESQMKTKFGITEFWM